MFGKSLAMAALASVALPVVANAAVDRAAPVAPRYTVSARPTSPAAPVDASRLKVLQEAVAARRETQDAILAIDHNKSDDAIAALERATGKLEIALARNPALALAPVDVATTSYDVLGSVKDVATIRDAARSAIDRGRLQEARRLMSGLASETVVAVSRLPLATYPGAIKRAAALLHQGKAPEARRVLEAALNTIVVDQTIIPLPLVRAEAAVAQARGLSAKANRTAAENARLRALLTTARTNLRLGETLGYATDKDMRNLIAAVDDLDRKTSGQAHGVGLLDRLGGLFEAARNASQPRTAKS